jgi:hypothetical protein
VPESGQLKRIVISLPLDELWTSKWPVEALRGQQVGAERIKENLRQGNAVFVQAEIGFPLRWYLGSDAVSFWRLVKPNLSQGEGDQ